MRLFGELSNDANATRAAQAGCLLIGAVPVVLFASLLIFVGARSLADPRALGNLWSCLGAGVAILGAWSLLLFWTLGIVPRRTIQTFELADSQFTCTTPRDGQRTYAVASLRTVRANYSRRCRRLVSWLIRFSDSRWIELDNDTTQAEVLVAAFEQGKERSS